MDKYQKIDKLKEFNVVINRKKLNDDINYSFGRGLEKVIRKYCKEYLRELKKDLKNQYPKSQWKNAYREKKNSLINFLWKTKINIFDLHRENKFERLSLKGLEELLNFITPFINKNLEVYFYDSLTNLFLDIMNVFYNYGYYGFKKIEKIKGTIDDMFDSDIERYFAFNSLMKDAKTYLSVETNKMNNYLNAIKELKETSKIASYFALANFKKFKSIDYHKAFENLRKLYNKKILYDTLLFLY